MEFKFNVNDIFKQPFVEVNNNLIPPGFSGDRRALWDTVGKVTEIVNAMGESSATAQGLTKPITTADRLRNSEHKLYFLIDQSANNGRGAVSGMLKTGHKGLYVFDRDGQHFQVSPPCVLDFYIHESRQRTGLGKQLFEHMLQKEEIRPMKMAIDRPSDKFLGFLNKHYSLKEPIKQMNNYVVFDGFFPEVAEKNGIVDNNISETPGKTKSANGLQTLSSAYGRYGAPRPTCSMGQIIHNQSSTVQKAQEPAGVRSEPIPKYQGPTVLSQNPAIIYSQSTPNVYSGGLQYQQQKLSNYTYNNVPGTQENFQLPPLGNNQNSQFNQQNVNYPQNYAIQPPGYVAPNYLQDSCPRYPYTRNQPVPFQSVGSENAQMGFNNTIPMQNNAHNQYVCQNYENEPDVYLNSGQNDALQYNMNYQQNGTDQAVENVESQNVSQTYEQAQYPMQQNISSQNEQNKAIHETPQNVVVPQTSQNQPTMPPNMLTIGQGQMQQSNTPSTTQQTTAVSQRNQISYNFLQPDASNQQTLESIPQNIQVASPQRETTFINNPSSLPQMNNQFGQYGGGQNQAEMAMQNMDDANASNHQFSMPNIPLNNLVPQSYNFRNDGQTDRAPTLTQWQSHPQASLPNMIPPTINDSQNNVQGHIQPVPSNPPSNIDPQQTSVVNFMPQGFIPNNVYNQLQASYSHPTNVSPNQIPLTSNNSSTPLEQPQPIMQNQFTNMVNQIQSRPIMQNNNSNQHYVNNVPIESNVCVEGTNGNLKQITTQQQGDEKTNTRLGNVISPDGKNIVSKPSGDGDVIKKPDGEGMLTYGYPPQNKVDTQVVVIEEKVSSSPKLERPRSLSIQLSEEQSDEKEANGIKGKIPIPDEVVNIEKEVEKINLSGQENIEMATEVDNKSTGKRTPSHLTEQGFFDLKFYHNKLW